MDFKNFRKHLVDVVWISPLYCYFKRLFVLAYFEHEGNFFDYLTLPANQVVRHFHLALLVGNLGQLGKVNI